MNPNSTSAAGCGSIIPTHYGDRAAYHIEGLQSSSIVIMPSMKTCCSSCTSEVAWEETLLISSILEVERQSSLAHEDSGAVLAQDSV